jgi:hypothetical protein
MGGLRLSDFNDPEMGPEDVPFVESKGNDAIEKSLEELLGVSEASEDEAWDSVSEEIVRGVNVEVAVGGDLAAVQETRSEKAADIGATALEEQSVGPPDVGVVPDDSTLSDASSETENHTAATGKRSAVEVSR